MEEREVQGRGALVALAAGRPQTSGRRRSPVMTMATPKVKISGDASGAPAKPTPSGPPGAPDHQAPHQPRPEAGVEGDGGQKITLACRRRRGRVQHPHHPKRSGSARVVSMNSSRPRCSPFQEREKRTSLSSGRRGMGGGSAPARPPPLGPRRPQSLTWSAAWPCPSRSCAPAGGRVRVVGVEGGNVLVGVHGDVDGIRSLVVLAAAPPGHRWSSSTPSLPGPPPPCPRSPCPPA